MASTLYISIPPRATIPANADWSSQVLPFALMSEEGHVQQQGQRRLSELREIAMNARQLSLLLAASDISLLTSKVPPMSAAKFKTALPNLFEEQIACDPADVVMVATAVVNGEATVAVADRVWLEALAKQVKDFPVKKIAAFPAQLGLVIPVSDSGVKESENAEESFVVALAEQYHATQELVLRTGAYAGLGLVLDQLDQSDKSQFLQMLAVLTDGRNVELHVPGNGQEDWQRALDQQKLSERIRLLPVSWQNRVAGLGHSGLNKAALDLMEGLGSVHKASFEWGPWRWPLRLVVMLVLVNVLGLNIQWFSLKREAKNLNDSLTQIYRSTYPGETIILDPLAQMQQKVALSQRMAGQLAPNDFIMLTSRFAQVWDGVMAGKAGTVMSIDYKERSLYVKPRSSSDIPLEQLRAALSAQSLMMSSSADGVLQIQVSSNGGKR
ncbi:type II secretion system protein GspL [Undibacterium sp. SXout7W]|uniref:type II secretion system protein GspL n=1 Tax=Undibacterium sp. SXout7W TaxID=3413049 RepID=UPI003BF18B31